ncbi:MAG: 16S rRNA (uracil(1498)-N(3))-methyltransferase [Gemmatimonadaceae bacterium]|nr:16S rRNA (uracil(1498)-N(3))-methyltransferase [Gemmatimonadaceae bacterium]MDQ3242857.1 16S rRNA (uracil(1498)-N(3))-methyltransferase [Gemmatimonadota bacterium]
MVERAADAEVVTFFSSDAFVPGTSVTLGEEAAQHARVIRVSPGEAVGLRDGRGNAAAGVIARAAKRSLTIDVATAWELAAPAAVHLMMPVGDRDRMLLLAEKATELAVTSWRPVMWRRSRSVGPRGDGPTFQSRVRNRMIGAMTQSGGGWLPEIHPLATPDRAIAAAPRGTRVMLDPFSETQLAATALFDPVVIALGPEGGIEAAESDSLAAAGFIGVSLGENVLRFETAGIAALAIVRAMLSLRTVPAGG